MFERGAVYFLLQLVQVDQEMGLHAEGNEGQRSFTDTSLRRRKRSRRRGRRRRGRKRTPLMRRSRIKVNKIL